LSFVCRREERIECVEILIYHQSIFVVPELDFFLLLFLQSLAVVVILNLDGDHGGRRRRRSSSPKC
jgi:hypothetical protein